VATIKGLVWQHKGNALAFLIHLLPSAKKCPKVNKSFIDSTLNHDIAITKVCTNSKTSGK